MGIHVESSSLILLASLTRKEVIKPVCGFHYFLEIFFEQAILSFLQTRDTYK